MLRKRCKQMVNNNAMILMKNGCCALSTSAYSYVFGSIQQIAHPATMGLRHGLQ
jgi:hypothetical protein